MLWFDAIVQRETQAMRRWSVCVAVLLLSNWTTVGWAQTFLSGSTGADGPFQPTANTTLPVPTSGIFHFTTVTIPTGVTVTFTPNATNTPVAILATGDVSLAAGSIVNVSGQPGTPGSSTGPLVNPGGSGGPGGFRGGQGGVRAPTGPVTFPSAGQGPGGGGLPTYPPPQFGGCGVGGTYGTPSTFTSLLSFFGGSGGGGQNGYPGSTSVSGSSGGGGGGAILIASSTRITVAGAIQANGGRGGTASNLTVLTAGSGSGGAIRLVAPEIAGSGSLVARSEAIGCEAGSPGVIRLETSRGLFSGTTNPVASVSTTMSPVAPGSTPPLVNLPTLAISSVGGAGVPANPVGLFGVADVTIPLEITNPVTVTVVATNIPVGTTFQVKLIPQAAAPTTLTSSASVGTFGLSTATATLNLPPGQVSVLHVFGSVALPQVAGLVPVIDGEPAERVFVAGGLNEPSTTMVVTKSGKEAPCRSFQQKTRSRWQERSMPCASARHE